MATAYTLLITLIIVIVMRPRYPRRAAQPGPPRPAGHVPVPPPPYRPVRPGRTPYGEPPARPRPTIVVVPVADGPPPSPDEIELRPY